MSVSVHWTGVDPPPEALRKKLIAAARLLLAEHQLEHGDLAVVLADDSLLQELNRRYRGLDGPTDVLSFPMLEAAGQEETAAEDPGGVIIGDVYISMERAEEQASAAGHSCEREALLLAIHGLLHLLGYDHESEAAAAAMRQKEEEILNMVEQFPVRER